jgi:hypothetical protein
VRFGIRVTEVRFGIRVTEMRFGIRVSALRLAESFRARHHARSGN